MATGKVPKKPRKGGKAATPPERPGQSSACTFAATASAVMPNSL